MQLSVIKRTFRYVFFSVGFVLFIAIAFQAAHQVNDPRYVKGSPYQQIAGKLINTAPSLKNYTDAQVTGAQTVAVTTASAATSQEIPTVVASAPTASTPNSTPSADNASTENAPHGKAIGYYKNSK